MKQTAVEWFNQQLVNRQNGEGDSRSWDEILDQAIGMFEKQIINAYKMGKYEHDKIVMSDTFYAEQYYNETFEK